MLARLNMRHPLDGSGCPQHPTLSSLQQPGVPLAPHLMRLRWCPGFFTPARQAGCFAPGALGKQWVGAVNRGLKVDKMVRANARTFSAQNHQGGRKEGGGEKRGRREDYLNSSLPKQRINTPLFGPGRPRNIPLRIIFMNFQCHHPSKGSKPRQAPKLCFLMGCFRCTDCRRPKGHKRVPKSSAVQPTKEVQGHLLLQAPSYPIERPYSGP